MINNERLLKNFLDMVVLDSESGHERPMCDFLKKYMTQFTGDIVEDDAGSKYGGECGNLIMHIPGTGPDAPRILLNAHMDTVSPGVGVEPLVQGDVVRSAGETILGADDKAGISAILEALHVLREQNLPHGPLDVIFTASEESHLQGARYLDPALLKADFAYTLDSTGGAGSIVTTSPSHDTLTARITGRAAHAGMEPEKGKNAIWIAARAIARMKLGRIDEETTANIGVIKGGHATNIVPEIADIQGEARSLDSAKLEAQIKHMVECLERTAAESEATVQIKTEHEYQSYNISEDSPVVRNAVAAAQALGIEPRIISSGGGSDANVFNARGLPTTPIGAAMADCHTTDENLSISALEGVARYTVELIRAR